AVLGSLARLEAAGAGGAVQIDVTGLADIDTTGAWLLRRLMTAKQSQGRDVALVGADRALEELIAVLPEQAPVPAADASADGPLFERVFAPFGKLVWELGSDLLSAMHILGSAVRGAQMKFGRGGGVSPASVVTQIDHMGVRAVPIIVLMSFLIGAIIAQQGAFQLRYFGAEIFVVDLVGILQLREVGVLLTAIMIAGRSGSA